MAAPDNPFVYSALIETRNQLLDVLGRSQIGSYKQEDLDQVRDIANVLRAANKESLIYLAAACDLSSTGLSKILRGRYNPRYSNFHKLVSGLLKVIDRRMLKEDSEKEYTTHTWTARWVPNPIFSNTERISELRDHLEHLVTVVQGSNDENNLPLTQLERAELIALLQTAIELLKAPKIETGLFQKIRNTGQEILRDSAKKEGSGAVSAAVQFALKAIRTYLGI